MDRRKRKTQDAIKKAFIHLASKNNIENITVKEIADLADISRKAFYLNYVDIYDLMHQVENEIIERVFSIMDNFKFDDLRNNVYPFLKQLSNELDEMPEFTNFLLNENNSSHLVSKFKKNLLEKISVAFEDKKIKLPDTFEFNITFIVSGIMDTFKTWYIGSKKSNLDTLCKSISCQISDGLKGLNM